MLIITQWTGRTGNNVLQLLHAIHYAKLNGYKTIQYPDHPYIMSNNIIIDTENITEKNDTVKGTFFYLEKDHCTHVPEPYILKMYFQTYIRSIFSPLQNDINLQVNEQDIYVHIRGGDIFSNNPHKSYVQPPLSYYRNIMVNYNYVKLICEDHRNPCVDELLKIEKVKNLSSSFLRDIALLSKTSNLIIGFGTFGFLIYLMNVNLKKIYIPEYGIAQLPKGSWGDDIEVNIVKLPNYIKVGEWHNTMEQRKIMINYTQNPL
jgi:hypothetical protein